MHEEGAPRTAPATVADRVRALRKALKLTQEELGKRGDLDRVEVTRVENGWNQATSGRIRHGLAKGFGLTLEAAYAYLEGRIDLEAALEQARAASKPAEDR